MDNTLAHRYFDLRTRIVENFSAENWEELGLLTDSTLLINEHPRLLRSLHWNDEDYAGNVLTVIRKIAESDQKNLSIIDSYLDKRFPDSSTSTYISAKPAERRITFSPYVFSVPEGEVEMDLVAVMMPFSAEFKPVFEAIKIAASSCNLKCLRADSIWEESTIIQDIFNLLFRAQVVIVDFSNRNPNVMYETGIAHTLGKHVVPITQSLEDVPFDMRHHRALKYLPNKEGLDKMVAELSSKLNQFRVNKAAIPAAFDDDDSPF